MEIIVFKVTGWDPGMLMNNPDSMVQAKSGISGKPKHRTGQDEADAKVYKDDKGYLRFPAAAFRSCMILAAPGRKWGKSSATNIVKGTVFPAEDWVQILDPKTWKPRTDYEVHTCTVIVNGSRIPRSRPWIKKWCCKVPMEVDVDLVDPYDVLELFAHAGKVVGIGDYRPRCPEGAGGRFGRFSVEFEHPERFIKKTTEKDGAQSTKRKG